MAFSELRKAFVHVHVEHIGAALDLLAGDRERGIVNCRLR